MPLDEKFSSIGKGRLEFLILNSAVGGKVYLADMLQRLSATESRHAGGHALCAAAHMRYPFTLIYCRPWR